MALLRVFGRGEVCSVFDGGRGEAQNAIEASGRDRQRDADDELGPGRTGRVRGRVFDGLEEDTAVTGSVNDGVQSTFTSSWEESSLSRYRAKVGASADENLRRAADVAMSRSAAESEKRTKNWSPRSLPGRTPTAE